MLLRFNWSLWRQPVRCCCSRVLESPGLSVTALHPIDRRKSPRRVRVLQFAKAHGWKSYSTDVHDYLERFLGTVKRRIENLLYTDAARPRGPSGWLTEKEFERVVFRFRDQVMKNLTERLQDGKYLQAPPRMPSPEELFNAYNSGGYSLLDSLLLRKFRQYSIVQGRPALSSDQAQAIKVADMRNPGEWYPAARCM